MSYQKIANLVKKIDERSQNNSIEWEETEKEGTYQLSFKNHSVRIFKKNASQYQGELYILQLINSDGEIIEEVNDEDLQDLLDTPYHMMKNIYEIARRQVMGVESALDSILDELTDDEIPF